VLRRRGTKDDHVGLGLLQASAVIDESALPWDAQFSNSLFHPRRLFVADADDFNTSMFVGVPQQVAHVKVVEVNPGKFPALGAHRFG
jgi:hypothetical protein